jgi:DNA-binding protein
MSAPETNMILGPTWNIRTELAIDAAEDLRNAGRATYVSRELDQSGKVVKEGECWELQKGKEELLLAFKDQFGQEAEIEVPMNPDAENVITVMEGEDIGALGAWGRAMSKAVGPGDVYEMIRAALHEKGIPVDRVDTACSVTSGNMNRLERIMEITLTENNISEIWAYKKPEIEIKVTAGGVTLRMPVKLRVTGAGQARDFNAVASGRTERPAMVKDKTMGVGLLKVDLRGGGGGGNEEMRSLVVSGMVM